MNVRKYFSPLLKEPSLIDGLPVIIRVNKFDEAGAKAFSGAIMNAHNTGQPVIPVIIDSYGGQVYSLMSMISDIKHAKLPVATIVQGKAMSCGALLFSCGTEGYRYMDPDATLMIHDVSSMKWGKVGEVKAGAEETERLNTKVYRMMAKNCGQSRNYFLDIIHKKGHADWYLDASQAKKHQLANYLRVPQLKIEATVKFDFK